MILEIRDGMEIKGCLDEVISKIDSLYRKDVLLGTRSGVFSGEIVQRTSTLVILKTPLGRRVMSGPNDGKDVYQYHYIDLHSIHAVTIETVE